jgi:hypothetical protein
MAGVAHFAVVGCTRSGFEMARIAALARRGAGGIRRLAIKARHAQAGLKVVRTSRAQKTIVVVIVVFGARRHYDEIFPSGAVAARGCVPGGGKLASLAY